MFPNTFSCVLLALSLFCVKYSSSLVTEMVCDDLRPTKYTLLDDAGSIELAVISQMESTDPFEPTLSLELKDYQPFRVFDVIKNVFRFEFSDKKYDYVCYQKQPGDKGFCESGSYPNFKSSDCSINFDTNTCKWLIKVGRNGLIDNENEAGIDLITKPDAAKLVLENLNRRKIVADYSIGLPLYYWSYALYCEANKKIFTFDVDMITLKKDEGSFEMFFYRLYEDIEKPRHVTMINSKNHSISIACDDDRNDVIVSIKTGLLEEPVLEEYTFRKYIDGLRCGIRLSIEMETKYSSFSFNDSPLKLIYKVKGSDDQIIEKLQFDSDSKATDKPEIETASTASVVQPVKDESQEHDDTVNPLIGVALTIITVVKSYFDLW